MSKFADTFWTVADMAWVVFQVLAVALIVFGWSMILIGKW